MIPSGPTCAEDGCPRPTPLRASVAILDGILTRANVPGPKSPWRLCTGNEEGRTALEDADLRRNRTRNFGGFEGAGVGRVCLAILEDEVNFRAPGEVFIKPALLRNVGR